MPLEEVSTENGRFVAIQVKAFTHRNNAEPAEVLDWTPVVFMR